MVFDEIQDCSRAIQSLKYFCEEMPEAVKTWAETHDYKEVEAIQDNILRDYADDFQSIPHRRLQSR